MGSGYDDILSVQLTRNKTSSIGRESREGRYVRGGRMVSDFTCPSEIRCFYPIGVKVTQNVAQYPLHNANHAPAKFEVAMCKMHLEEIYFLVNASPNNTQHIPIILGRGFGIMKR